MNAGNRNAVAIAVAEVEKLCTIEIEEAIGELVKHLGLKLNFTLSVMRHTNPDYVWQLSISNRKAFTILFCKDIDIEMPKLIAEAIEFIHKKC